MQIPAQSPSGENGLGDLCTIGPDSNLGGKQAGKRRASSERASAGSGQCYLRKELGFGHAYFSVGCNQNLLGLTNVWTTLDERRWQARRHFGWKFLIDQAEPTRHTIRIISKENIDGIFFLADFALQIWDVSVRSVQDLLRLQDIKLRGDAMLKAELRQLKRSISDKSKKIVFRLEGIVLTATEISTSPDLGKEARTRNRKLSARSVN